MVSFPFHDMGMRWNQNRQDESPKASFFQLFSSAKIFFSSKDDASFQEVFTLRTVSSVYFTTVKCVPFRPYMSLLQPNLSFSAVLVATQKNKCDLFSPFNEVQRPINLCHWSFIFLVALFSFMKNFRCRKAMENAINLTI